MQYIADLRLYILIACAIICGSIAGFRILKTKLKK
jgi:hypothetical protein